MHYDEPRIALCGEVPRIGRGRSEYHSTALPAFMKPLGVRQPTPPKATLNSKCAVLPFRLLQSMIRHRI